MGIQSSDIESAFKEMGLAYEMDEGTFVTATQGRYAPGISAVVTMDEDCSGATIMALLDPIIEGDHRKVVYELLNLCHGQSLWNVRYHLDEDGHVFSVGKVMTWGKSFNPVQFGDIYFSLVVAVDRLYPCLMAVQLDEANAEEAFEKFFVKSSSPPLVRE